MYQQTKQGHTHLDLDELDVEDHLDAVTLERLADKLGGVGVLAREELLSGVEWSGVEWSGVEWSGVGMREGWSDGGSRCDVSTKHACKYQYQA